VHGSFTPSLGEIEWARELTRRAGTDALARLDRGAAHPLRGIDGQVAKG
jgi:hypothetical protein